MVHFVQLLNTIVSSKAEAHACGEDSMYDIVISHVTDQPFLYHVTPHGISEIFGNLIFKLNTMLGFHVPDATPVTECLHGHAMEVILATPVKLFGIFDLRITKWVIMLWVTMFLCALVFIPLARKIKNSPMGSKSRWVNLWESLIDLCTMKLLSRILSKIMQKKQCLISVQCFSSFFLRITWALYRGQLQLPVTLL